MWRRHPPIRQHGRRLMFVEAFTRRGYRSWLQEIPFCGVESVADVPSVRCKVQLTRSQRRPRRINLSALARPPPEVTGQTPGHGAY